MQFTKRAFLRSLSAFPVLACLPFRAMSAVVSPTAGRHVVGFKIYYGDGTVIDSRKTSWSQAPSDNVQLLMVFFRDTYRIWHEDHWDVEHYRDMYFGLDYYWQFGNGQAADVPPGAQVKLGREIDHDKWRDLYNRALQDTKWE